MVKVNKADTKKVITALKELQIATSKMHSGTKTAGLSFLTIAVENLQRNIDQYIKDFNEIYRR